MTPGDTMEWMRVMARSLEQIAPSDMKWHSMAQAHIEDLKPKLEALGALGEQVEEARPGTPDPELIEEYMRRCADLAGSAFVAAYGLARGYTNLDVSEMCALLSEYIETRQ